MKSQPFEDDQAERTAALLLDLEADELKGVLRQSSILDGSRKENSAEHSWHLALMAQVLGDYAPPGTDLSRVTAMLLIHDLVEIDAGDLFVYAEATAQAHQEAAEHAAADRIFALLPPGQGRGLRALWDEFEERRPPEARFARALDRLQPMLANYYLGGGTWQAHGVRAGQVLPSWGRGAISRVAGVSCPRIASTASPGSRSRRRART